MTIELNDLLLILLYVALIIFVIVLIVLGIKLIKTLKKVDSILDNANTKMTQLDGVFSIVDMTSDYALSLRDKVLKTISKIFKKKGTDTDE